MLLVAAALSLYPAGRLMAFARFRRSVPAGLELSRHEAPGLFSVLDELCLRMGAPPFEAVLLEAEMNAFVKNGPRMRKGGGSRRYLSLGVPLLQAMSPEEMGAVLAHELAHQQQQTAIGRRLERLVRWAEILGLGRGVFDSPGRWLLPRLFARAWVHSRFCELEADAAAANATSAPDMGSALVRLGTTSLQFDQWTRRMIRESIRRAEAPESITAEWAAELAQPNESHRRGWEQSFAGTATCASTHPSAAERLRALGQELPSRIPDAPSRNAAALWLGPALPAVFRKYDFWWRACHEGGWAGARRNLQLAAAGRSAESPKTSVEAWAHAVATLELEGEDAAQSPMEQVLAFDSLHIPATQWLITRDLQMDAPGALERLRALTPATQSRDLWLFAADWCNRRGDPDGELDAVTRAAAFANHHSLHLARTSAICPGTVFGPHSLTPEQVALLAERAAVHPDICELAIASWENPAAPGGISHILGVRLTSNKRLLLGGSLPHLSQALAAARVTSPCDFEVLSRHSPRFTRAVFGLPGALIYDSRHASR